MNIWKTLFKTKRISPEQQLEFQAWAYRQYFSPKYKDNSWFSEVTPETVLEEFTKPGTPVTPVVLLDLWEMRNSIQKTLGAETFEEDLEAVAAAIPPTKKQKYSKEEMTFLDIADEFGNIMKTMAQKIFLIAGKKIRKLTNGVPPDELSELEFLTVETKVAKARKQAALFFAGELIENKDNINRFLFQLLEHRYFSRKELAYVTEEEKNFLSVLATFPPEEIANILISDIEDEENLFKTYQTVASRVLFWKTRGTNDEFNDNEDAPESS